MPVMDRSARAIQTLAQEDPDFRALCEVLYGDVDPETVWSDVFKREPQKAKGDTQRRVAAASNALGLTAGAAAIGSTLRDDRLEQGGKWARRLHATGKKIPAPIAGRTFTPRVAGRLALGAAALQGANVAGDVVVARTLPKAEKKITRKKKQPVAKASLGELANGAYNGFLGMLKPTGKHISKPPPGSPKVPGGNPERNAKIGNALGEFRQNPLKAAVATPGRAATTATGGTFLATRPGKRRAENKAYEAGYYAKSDTVAKPMPDLELAGTFSKFDDEKRQAFGYASVVKKNGMPVIDRQGDYIDLEEMEKAAYHYVQKSRVGGDMHKRQADEHGIDRAHHVSDLIESVVFTREKCEAMGLPEEITKQLEGHWWVGYQIHDEDTWQEVRKKGRTGFSIHGRGKRVDTSIDELV